MVQSSFRSLTSLTAYFWFFSFWGLFERLRREPTLLTESGPSELELLLELKDPMRTFEVPPLLLFFGATLTGWRSSTYGSLLPPVRALRACRTFWRSLLASYNIFSDGWVYIFGVIGALGEAGPSWRHGNEGLATIRPFQVREVHVGDFAAGRKADENGQ